MIGTLRQYARLTRVALLHFLAISDRAKWREFPFPKEWTPRLKWIAAMIPDGSDVFEFGAGPVGLRPFLNPTCRLTSSDLVRRDGQTVVLDLNRRPLPTFDMPTEIAVFAGVLEYVSDVPSVAAWLAKSFTTCIVTYQDAPQVHGLGRLRQALGRTHMGWVNHFSEQEFVQLFMVAGFSLLKRECWAAEDPEAVFVFGKDTQPAPDTA